MGNQPQPRSTADRRDAETPGAAGHPEPGSGHDDSETTTIADGPPIRRVDGVPGASGHAEGVDAPLSDIMGESEE